MKDLILAMWIDDRGAVISVELILVIAIVVLGVIPGLVALRNTSIASMVSLGNAIMSLQTGFSFAAIMVVGTPPTGATIAIVLGASFTPASPEFLRTANPGVDYVLQNTGVVVSPAP